MAGVFERTQVGKREDLADYIANVDMSATPVMSRIRMGKKLTNTLPYWQVDSYPDPNMDGVVDGKDAENFEDLGNRDTLHGVAQKFWRKPRVSDMAEHVSDVAGARSEMAYQVKRGFTMLKRDMESRICAFTKEAQKDTGAVPYETRSLGRWIQSGAQSLFPVPEKYRTPAAQIDATAVDNVTEDTLNGIMRSIWNQCGEKKNFLAPMGSTLKARLSTFASYAPDGTVPLREWHANQEAKKVLQQVDVIENDFGTLELVLSNFISRDEQDHQFRRGLILDLDMMELRWNRRPRVKPLEDQGGGPRAIVDAIMCLVVKNPLGFGKLAATADS